VLDENSVLVEDTAVGGEWPEGPARFRLLHRVRTPSSSMTTASMGRHGWGEERYVVDEEAGTLRPVDR
jgi:hypothetical protein